MKPRAGALDLECVVLCGGFGTRLAAAYDAGPKALAPVAGRPFLHWLLLHLRRSGITRVVLATGHRGDLIEASCGDGARFDLSIRYSREPRPLGTAGALRLALPLTDGDPLLVVNGDTYCGADLAALLDAHRAAAARATIAVVEVADAGRFGSVSVASNGEVDGFIEKGTRGPGWISSGTYLVGRDVVSAIAAGVPASLESDVFPALIDNGLHAVRVAGPFIDIGTPDSYREAAAVMGMSLDDLGRPSAEVQAETARQHLDAASRVIATASAQCIPEILSAAATIAAAFRDGRKLLICGNGGSAADAQHVAAEFVSRLRSTVERRALPAIALTTDTSFITAYANDYEWEGVFARQLEALGQPGDVVLLISTSGSSRNVVRAAETARSLELRTIALTGDGGDLRTLCDEAVVIPSTVTGAIQECMLAVEHTICELVEDELFARPAQPDLDAT